jgi:hypothetical protein
MIISANWGDSIAGIHGIAQQPIRLTLLRTWLLTAPP